MIANQSPKGLARARIPAIQAASATGAWPAERLVSLMTPRSLLPLALSVCALGSCGRPDDHASQTPVAEEAACARDGAVRVASAWARKASSQGMSAAFFVLCNGTDETVTLVGAAMNAAGVAELHETRRSADGVASMRKLDVQAVAPGERVAFRPGGKHVMLLQLKRPLEPGSTETLELRFASGARIEVPTEIRAREAIEGQPD